MNQTAAVVHLLPLRPSRIGTHTEATSRRCCERTGGATRSTSRRVAPQRDSRCDATSKRVTTGRRHITVQYLPARFSTGGCSHLPRGERAKSPHFLDRDARDRAVGAGVFRCGGEPARGSGGFPLLCQSGPATPLPADRRDKTTSRPATRNTLSRLRTAPHGGSAGPRPPARPPPVGCASSPESEYPLAETENCLINAINSN